MNRGPKAARSRYTWYMRGVFRNRFDPSHWWKSESDLEPGAALYELARRHPLVREYWLKNFAAATHNRRGVAVWLPSIRERWTEKMLRPQHGSILAPSLYWTCLLGLNSWAKLGWSDRINWQSSVGNMKGLDFRDDMSQCKPIKLYAHWKIIDQRKASLSDRGKTYDELSNLVRKDLATNPPTPADWEAAIAQCAVEASRDGYVLLAVAPDLSRDKAESVMAKKYRDHLRLYPPETASQRARWKDWLPLISAFEDAETLTGGAKSQVFVRYRLALDAIRFT